MSLRSVLWDTQAIDLLRIVLAFPSLRSLKCGQDLQLQSPGKTNSEIGTNFTDNAAFKRIKTRLAAQLHLTWLTVSQSYVCVHDALIINNLQISCTPSNSPVMMSLLEVSKRTIERLNLEFARWNEIDHTAGAFLLTSQSRTCL